MAQVPGIFLLRGVKALRQDQLFREFRAGNGCTVVSSKIAQKQIRDNLPPRRFYHYVEVYTFAIISLFTAKFYPLQISCLYAVSTCASTGAVWLQETAETHVLSNLSEQT